MMVTQIFKDATEEDILKEIQSLRQQGPGAFRGYLKGLKPFVVWGSPSTP